MASGKSRPILITLLALLYFLVGVLCIIGGAALITGAVTAEDLEEGASDLGTIGGAVALIYGLIMVVIAGGFWNGWKIMWILGVIFSALGAIFGIVSIFQTGFGGILPTIMACIILWYLFRPKVKSFFGM